MAMSAEYRSKFDTFQLPGNNDDSIWVKKTNETGVHNTGVLPR